MIEIFISGATPSSKNSKMWTGRFLIASKATQKWRKDTENEWIEGAAKFREEFDKREKPVKVNFRFVRGSKHKFDYVNPLQTVLDEMVKYEWISDDNSDVIIPVFDKYEYNKQNPGVWIKLE